MFTKTLQLFRMYRDFLSSKISQISSKSSQWGETCGCSECKKSFSTLIDLDKHIKGHTEAQTELFSCSDCTQCFSQLSFLKKHSRIHTGENHSAVPSLISRSQHEGIWKSMWELTWSPNHSVVYSVISHSVTRKVWNAMHVTIICYLLKLESCNR